MSKVRILSDSGEQFKDRIEAGKLLADELKEYKGKDAVVLGIPRGGIIIASGIAGLIDGELDIVLSRKLKAPDNPELAIGAIAEGGKLFLHEMLSEGFADSKYIEKEKAHQLAEIGRRIKLYRAIRAKAALKGRIVIITDDGLATGATMQAALWSAAQEGPKRLIAAVPVAPEDTIERIAPDADELICLRSPEFFAAVGQFYRHFDQVEDEEVLAILKKNYPH